MMNFGFIQKIMYARMNIYFPIDCHELYLKAKLHKGHSFLLINLNLNTFLYYLFYILT